MSGTDVVGGIKTSWQGGRERSPKDQKDIEERSVLKAGGIRYHLKFGKDRTKRTQLDLVTRSLFVFGMSGAEG